MCIQFLQSQPDREAKLPGKFKFIPVPISDDDAAGEESYLFALPGGPYIADAEKFIALMRVPEALAILRK